jgi:hypothetical protein
MLGSASNDTLDTIFPKINNEIAKLFEDRNILLTQGGLITFTGTQVEFTETLYLVLNQKISGAVPQIISLGSSTQLFTNSGDMLIATVDRTAGTAVLSVVTSGNPLPAVDSSNQDVFLIAVRYDAVDGTQRLYWRTGMAMNAGQTIRLGSSGSGSGSGLGDDVITTQFSASFTDEFDEGPTAALSAVNSTLTKATYSAAKALYQISYDATKLGSATGVNVSVASAPSFTVQVGDMFIRNNEAKRIIGVVSQTTYQVESAFSSNFVSQAVTVSQAVHSKDVYNIALDGSAISAAFTDSFSEILVDYEDTSAVGDAIFDINVAPVVGFSASVDNTTWTNTETRPTSPLTEIQTTLFSTAGTSLYVRLFANKTSGSGTVNVLKYKAYVQKVPTDSSGGVLNSAYAFTNGVGTPVNCSLSVVGGKTRVTLTWQYPVGINVGTPFGSIDVYLNGQLIPRYINATLTPNASFTEVSSTAIDLDSNYSAVNVSVEILQRAAIVDQSSQNSTYIAVNTTAIAAIQTTLSLDPTVQKFTSGSGTDTLPANVKYIRVRMVGGGGGGQGSVNTAWAAAGGNGTSSTFGLILTAPGGNGGNINIANGAPAPTISAPAIAVASFAGMNGFSGQGKTAGLDSSSGAGGSTPFGGAGASAVGAITGFSGIANSGSGGGGAGMLISSAGSMGQGGGAGSYIEAIIQNPSPTYSYSVGTGGAGGLAGAGGSAGGAGGSGQIIVEEYYV